MGFLDKLRRNKEKEPSDNTIELVSLQNNIKGFGYLANLINSSDGIVNLDFDIVLEDVEAHNFVEGIGIQKPLVINGNGHYIDARNSARIFTIFPNIEVKLNGITFKNGTGKFGGAIVNLSNLTISTCFFNENNSEVGGAVYNKSQILITDSHFNNNKASTIGGAIANFGTLNLINNHFNSNFSIIDGGAINNQDNSTMVASKCYFKENNAGNGGAIGCIENVELDNCEFTNNTSDKNGGSLSCQSGILTINHCVFNNNRSENGGALSVNKMGISKIFDCQFNENVAKYGGSIDVYGELIITESDFIKNSSPESGGAIFIEKDAKSEISICNFNNNEAISGEFGSVLANRGDTKLIKSNFINNNTYQGAVSNQPDAILDVSGCCFNQNIARMGGALSNFGNLTLYDSKFCENSAKDDGGAIDNGKGGIIKSTECKFLKNYADYSGGSIRNEGEFNISNNHFKNNSALIGGAIVNFGLLSINKANFNDNFSKSSKTNFSAGVTQLKDNSDADIIFNNSEVTIVNSTFTCNEGDLGNVSFDSIKNSLVNNNCLKIIDSTFEAVMSKSILLNNKNSNLFITDSRFKNNSVKESVIFNDGKCNVDNCTFDENASLKENCKDITNKSSLKLTKPKFKYENISKSVLNNGYMELIKLSDEEIDDYILNNKDIKVVSEEIEDNLSNFKYLSDLINGFVDEPVVLDRDIVLNDSELDFYGGGIEIDKDNFVLDGNGHSIDGIGKSRIFYITAKKVKLKNIVFKNGFAPNFQDNHTDGGGALRITKSGEINLVECEFINNKSFDDGGAIFNRGVMESNSSYENNVSESLGGAICNNGTYVSIQDKFIYNVAKVGSAIFNSFNCDLIQIHLNSNESNVDKPIYNIGDIKVSDDNLNNVYNHGTINKEMSVDVYSFKDLNEKISDSNQIYLTNDVVFDFSVDEEFIDGISIDKDLVIVGDGNVTIDAKKSASFFNISNKCNVSFRNIIFKNGKSKNISLIKNDGVTDFEYCIFLNNKALKETNLIENSNNIKLTSCVFSSNVSFKESIFRNLTNHKEHCVFEIRDCDFFNNKSYGKSIIFIIGNASVSVASSNFIYNISEINGSLLYNYNGDLKVNGSKFADNFAKFYSVLHNDRYANTIMEDCEFVNNHSNDSVIGNLGLLEFNESKFKHHVLDRFGVIHNAKGELKIHNCDFNDNRSSMLAGAISNFSKIYLHKTNFVNNYSEFGGAINNQKGGILNINDCCFSNNCASETGGAIDHVSEELLEIVQSNFELNSSKGLGGVISCHGPFKIESTTFCENSAGGAGVLYNANGGEGSIIGGIFSKNSARQVGGAIFNDENSSLNIDDSTFSDNEAEVQGGAIFNYSHVEVYKSKFENNHAKNAAGAIDNNRNGFIKLEDCIFNDNHVDEIEGQTHGNAIGMLSSGQIIKCIFSEKDPVTSNLDIDISTCIFTYGLDKKQDDNLKGDGNFRLF